MFQTLFKVFLVAQIFGSAFFIKSTTAQLRVGVFADCQYCNCETKGKRYYSNSLSKLSKSVVTFNAKKVGFVIGLGDLIDRDFASFKEVNTVLSELDMKVHHVNGNHDFDVAKEHKDCVAKALYQKQKYYTFHKGDWQFVFLDGTDVSTYSNDPDKAESAKLMLARLKEEGKPNARNWNGGMGQKQLEWLEDQLYKADKRKKNVLLFCHYPLLPYEAHCLWNSNEVLEILNRHSCVKAWINGHNHKGGYAFEQGIHFVTLKGMVDTENENAYSIISLSEGEINIEGFGREESRILRIE